MIHWYIQYRPSVAFDAESLEGASSSSSSLLHTRASFFIFIFIFVDYFFLGIRVILCVRVWCSINFSPPTMSEGNESHHTCLGQTVVYPWAGNAVSLTVLGGSSFNGIHHYHHHHPVFPPWPSFFSLSSPLASSKNITLCTEILHLILQLYWTETVSFRIVYCLILSFSYRSRPQTYQISKTSLWLPLKTTGLSQID